MHRHTKLRGHVEEQKDGRDKREIYLSALSFQSHKLSQAIWALRELVLCVNALWVEEDLVHLSLNPALLYQLSCFCPCLVLTLCPTAAGSCSIGCEQPHLDPKGSWLPLLRQQHT